MEGGEQQLIRYTDKRTNNGSRPTMFVPDELVDNCRKVLESVYGFLTSYVTMSVPQAIVASLWVVHTHLAHLSFCTPYIAVTSATKRAGKTRLLEVSELLVANPLRTANITEAALFRALASKTRTLLLDEVDTIFGEGKSRELLRAILNASYRRGSPVYRTKGKHVEGFDVFSPKMIAGIGDLPDTVADRSIPIRLVRSKAPKRFRQMEATAAAGPIKQSIIDAFGDDRILRAIYDARPELPDHLHDRQQDSWEPLIQIAVVAGWKDEVYQAARELYATDEPWKKQEGGETDA